MDHHPTLTLSSATAVVAGTRDIAIGPLPRNDRIPILRRAFAGLSLKALAIVAALLFIRSISATVDNLADVGNRAQVAVWIVEVVEGFASLLIMAAPIILIIVATANLGPKRGRARMVALALAVVLGTGVGVLARILCMPPDGEPRATLLLSFTLYVWPRYMVVAGLLTVVVELHLREAANAASADEAKLDSVALERELAVAQLRALQAQIEPHFLFNTLANVRRLYDEDRIAGQAMLESLMRYIEVALPAMRGGASSLAHEAELIEAYLHIQRIRMGARLAFAIDIPPELRELTVPPMMLLTLVENAVKHGLAPSREGGRIRVSADVDEDRLRLSVADTGVGFLSASGSGIGLANVSARLASQFGDRAALALENNALGGATATIVLPLPAA